MLAKVFAVLIGLVFLTTFLGAYACAWGFDPKYAFMPTATVFTLGVLTAIYAAIKEL